MLIPSRALSLHAEAGKELPRIEAFTDLYARGIRPRQGQVIMIAGRSGTQKSGLALYWTAQMNLPTLYFSADMSPFTASSRLACMFTGDTTEIVEAEMSLGGARAERYRQALDHLQFQFSFGSPITWPSIDNELEAFIHMHNAFPQVMVFDNLMDFAGAEADYTAQMEVMSLITELARETGSTCIVLHHASDKTWEAKADPWRPPSRDQVKGGLSEKPELSLSVALDPTSYEYNIAAIKQRMGPSDPTAQTYVTLRCHPEQTRFSRYRIGMNGGHE